MISHQPLNAFMSYPRNLRVYVDNLRVLLLDIVLSTTLLALANIVFLLSINLSIAVTSDSSDGSSNSTTDSVADTRGQVVDLALSFLALAGSVLFLTFTLQALLESELAIVRPCIDGGM